MATPNLTTGCTAVPQFPVKRRMSYDVVVITFEDDATIARKVSDTKHQNPIRLVYAAQSDSEKASFEAFFDARFGAYEFFYWNDTRTGENDIKVRFVESSVEFVADGPRTWSWVVNLQKVLS
jgi:hypothetical protein